MRKRTIGPGAATMVGRQCGHCGRLVGKWVKLETVPNWQALPGWDYEAELLWQDHEKTYMREYRAHMVENQWVAAFGRPAQVPGFWEKYNEYLRSPEWQETRGRVMERANGLCEGCRINRATQVHHLTYDRVGREMLFDLVAICDTCHDLVHGKT